MTPRELRNSIDNLLSQLANLDVVAVLPVVRIQQLRARRWRVGFRPTMASTASNSFGTIAEYVDALERGAFSCVLCDGSLLQLSYEVEANEIVRHRLTFLPCPCPLPKGMINQGPVLDMFYERAQDAEAFALRTPFRFDFAPESRAKNHSACHLHWNHAAARCSVSGPLHPREFVRFVLRHCYPELWAERDELQRIERSQLARSIELDDEREFYLNCRASS